MRIIKPSVEFFGAVPTDYDGNLKFIEMAGRTCYKSENKITPDSAEKFVRKLIKARHLAMVEHSNFVTKLGCICTDLEWDRLAGKYLTCIIKNGNTYVGGNLTAWYQRATNFDIPDFFFDPFIIKYKDLFKLEQHPMDSAWEVCPFDEIPQELHRYSAKFICDRGVSHELVRHRPCSFAQESTRYVNYAGKDMEFIEPAGFEDWSDTEKMIFLAARSVSELYYDMLTRGGKTPQQARAVLPNALKTEVIVTADLAEWQHIFKLRCHNSAHPDMVRVMTMLKEKFIEEGLISEQ